MVKRVEEINVSVPVIVQTVGGDLTLRGREGNALIVDGDNPQVENLGGGQPYLVRCAGDCRVGVPLDIDVVIQRVGGDAPGQRPQHLLRIAPVAGHKHMAQVAAQRRLALHQVHQRVGGDARLADVGGSIAIQNIGGDLTVGHVGKAVINDVSGDLRLKWVEGDVHIENVGGDATVRDISGSVRIENVGADVLIRSVEGDCVVERAGEDLVLNIAFHPGHEYRFGTGGDILCRSQPESGARFVLPAHMEYELEVEAETTEGEAPGETIITVGDGAATVRLTAGSELRIIGEGDDYVYNLGTQIEEELEARLSSLEAKLSRQFEGLDERIQANSERFAEQAARFAAQAARQAERQVERARRSLDRRKMKSRKRDFSGPHFSWGVPEPPKPPKPPRPRAEPVREEERLMILRMVQESKITIEEAERLLAALDRQE